MARKFNLNDIIVTKNKHWFVEGQLNSFKIIGIEEPDYYVALHRLDWYKEDNILYSSKWKFEFMDEQFEIDLKERRKRKLIKLNEL